MAALGEWQEISALQSAKAMARISECSCKEQMAFWLAAQRIACRRLCRENRSGATGGGAGCAVLSAARWLWTGGITKPCCEWACFAGHVWHLRGGAWVWEGWEGGESRKLLLWHCPAWSLCSWHLGEVGTSVPMIGWVAKMSLLIAALFSLYRRVEVGGAEKQTCLFLIVQWRKGQEGEKRKHHQIIKKYIYHLGFHQFKRF